MASMTAKEIASVQKDWKVIARDVTGFGINAFEDLFAVKPNYSGLFRGINEMGEKTLANPKMREHAVRVFSAFGSWVTNLDDPPVLANLLKQQGQEHKGRSIGETHFNDMRPALMSALRTQFGSFDQMAWEKAYSIFVEGLAKGWK